MKERVRMVIFNGDSVLLIHRNKNGEEYWVFPGGGVEEGESHEVAVKREALEELGVSVNIDKQFAIHDLKIDGKEPQREIFYSCSITGGELGTGNGPEFQKGTSYVGEYALEWVSSEELRQRRVRPETIKKKLIEEVIGNENIITKRS